MVASMPKINIRVAAEEAIRSLKRLLLIKSLRFPMLFQKSKTIVSQKAAKVVNIEALCLQYHCPKYRSYSNKPLLCKFDCLLSENRCPVTMECSRI